MNIGIIHSFVGGGGGTEKTLHGILDALEQTDHNVTLYTFSKPKFELENIKIKTTIPFSIPSFGLYQRAMESKLISKAKDEDILIQASGGMGITKNKNQKMIVYCHSDLRSELDNPITKYKGIWALYYKSYYKMIKKFTEQILDSNVYLISNSKYVHDSIKQTFDKDSNIIYPPVNTNEFSAKSKENTIVTIGRFSEEKNLSFGIDIIGKFDCKYEIIGNTKTKSNILYFEKLNSKIKHNNLSNIILNKNIDRKKLVDILNKAKIYFHSSRETFGISVVEAISAGCIPIVPDIGAHKETVPYDELRYLENNFDDAEEKLRCALNGTFDHLKEPLMNSTVKFNRQTFMKNILEYIESI